MSQHYYCDKSRQPCSTPYTCSAGCYLITANRDQSCRSCLVTPPAHRFPPISFYSACIAVGSVIGLVVGLYRHFS